MRIWRVAGRLDEELSQRASGQPLLWDEPSPRRGGEPLAVTRGVAARCQHDRGRRVAQGEQLGDRHPVESWQPDIEQDHVRVSVGHGRKRGLAVRHLGHDFEAGALDDYPCDSTELGVVIDDQYGARGQAAILRYEATCIAIWCLAS